jgi:putative nucleotidyltransferase with HDIG domain
MILGMQQVRNLVLSVGAISMFEVKGPRQQEMLRRFWLHAFSTAAGAQIIGRHKKIETNDQEVVFVGGLLHDIGRLFMFANFTAAYEQLVKRALSSSMTVEMAEWSLLGIGHAEVGQSMAEHWHLPQGLIDVIGTHEGPFQGDEGATVYCVHLADALSKHLYYAGTSTFTMSVDPVAQEWLNFDESQFENLGHQIAIKTEEAIGLFQQLAA